MNSGGPAFPIVIPNSAAWSEYSEGMTLRDWFAGQAMSSLVAVCAVSEDRRNLLMQMCRAANTDPADEIASLAYVHADAMLLALEKAEPKPAQPKRTYADFEWTPGNQWESLSGPSGKGDEAPDTAARRRLGYAGPSYVKFRRAGTHEPVTAEQIRAEVEGVR